MAVALEDVRALDPDRLGRDVDAAVYQPRARADHALGDGIELLDPDRAVAFVERFARRRAVVDDPGAAVVEEQGRIDAADDFRQPDRVGPGAGGVRRGDDEVAAAVDAGVENGEGAGGGVERGGGT